MQISSTKKNTINRFSETDYRSKRLLHIFWTCQITIVFASIQRVFTGHMLDLAIIAIVGILLLPVYFWAKTKKSEWGANWLSLILTLVVLTFMWPYEGARDEILLVFPAIFTFSVLTGATRAATILLAVVLFNLIIMSYLQETGLYTFSPGLNSYNSATLIVILLSLSCFAVWILARDLRQAFANLARENKRVLNSQAEIEKLVHYDPLTGLPNRILARLSFDLFIERLKRQSTKLAVMFVDLDDFKHVNDTLGHSAGDEFINIIATRLQATVRTSDVVCRLGGDEFLIILPDLDEDADVKKVAEKLLSEVNTPIEIGGKQLRVSCSIGIAMAPDDGITFEELFMKADMAMYRGKDRGKNEALTFQIEWMNEHSRHLKLVNGINEALSKQQLELYFQTLTDLKKDKVIACEALLRWNHPKLGQVPPNEFIPVAESTGAILDIGEWVIFQACKKIQDLNKRGIKLDVAVNVSAIQFTRSNLVEIVERSIKEFDIPANQLELEFTESLFINDIDSVSNKLKKLRIIGVKLSIDDFGTGYSNLSNLQYFDIQKLKIDRSFIKDITENKDNQNIVSAIEQMAKSLNLETVAEGIEDQATSNLIEDIGCSYGQGYYWSKPLPESEFDALLKEKYSS